MGVKSGHYIAVCRSYNDDSEWVIFNDNSAKHIEKHTPNFYIDDNSISMPFKITDKSNTVDEFCPYLLLFYSMIIEDNRIIKSP